MLAIIAVDLYMETHILCCAVSRYSCDCEEWNHSLLISRPHYIIKMNVCLFDSHMEVLTIRRLLISRASVTSPTVSSYLMHVSLSSPYQVLTELTHIKKIFLREYNVSGWEVVY